MTTEEFKSLFDNEIMPAISSMREAGQKEYAQDIDEIFANFHRIADDMSIDRKQVLMVYMLKHIDGINAFIKGHESQTIRDLTEEHNIFPLKGMVEQIDKLIENSELALLSLRKWKIQHKPGETDG